MREMDVAVIRCYRRLVFKNRLRETFRLLRVFEIVGRAWSLGNLIPWKIQVLYNVLKENTPCSGL